MSFQPAVGDRLEIGGRTYRMAEHPNAPGVPYGQEGRAAIVYQLLAKGGPQALKAFKTTFRAPTQIPLAERLAGLSSRCAHVTEALGFAATVSRADLCCAYAVGARAHLAGGALPQKDCCLGFPCL